MKQAYTFTFQFADPNSPAVSEAALKQILLEKLLAQLACREYRQDEG